MKAIAIRIAALFVSVVVGVDAGAATTAYQYDALGRLTTVAQGAAQTTYNYDAAGNRLAKQATSITPTAITLSGNTTVVENQSGAVTLSFKVGNSTAAGTVSFYDIATLIGTATVTDGVATVQVTGLPLGTNTITVAYSGSGSLAANSATTTINVVDLSWLSAVLQMLLD